MLGAQETLVTTASHDTVLSSACIARSPPEQWSATLSLGLSGSPCAPGEPDMQLEPLLPFGVVTSTVQMHVRSLLFLSSLSQLPPVL